MGTSSLGRPVPDQSGAGPLDEILFADTTSRDESQTFMNSQTYAQDSVYVNDPWRSAAPQHRGPVRSTSRDRQWDANAVVGLQGVLDRMAPSSRPDDRPRNDAPDGWCTLFTNRDAESAGQTRASGIPTTNDAISGNKRNSSGSLV
jgi:hypothetical protein